MAFYVDGLPAITSAIVESGVRIIDEGATAFTHPKDFPGMIEVFDPGMAGGSLPDPRRKAGWSAAYWREHPLGLRRASHVTAVVHDHRAAAKLYVELLGGTVLPEQPASTPAGRPPSWPSAPRRSSSCSTDRPHLPPRRRPRRGR